MQHLDHALGLRVHRAAVGEIRNSLGDVEEAGDPAVGEVDHDRFVDRMLTFLARVTISRILPVSEQSA